MYHPTSAIPAYCISLPTNDDSLRERHESEIMDIILSHKNINDLRNNLKSYIKEMAINEITINDNIQTIQTEGRPVMAWVNS